MRPEERVRQRLLHHLVHRLHFPQELIVVEKALKELPHVNAACVPDRRLDLLCYAGKTLLPLLLIECKRGIVDQSAVDQVLGYNAFVGAPFVAVVGGEQVYFGRRDPKTKAYHFGGEIPTYQELIACSQPFCADMTT